MDLSDRFPIEQQQDQRLQLRSTWTLVSSICRLSARKAFKLKTELISLFCQFTNPTLIPTEFLNSNFNFKSKELICFILT